LAPGVAKTLSATFHAAADRVPWPPRVDFDVQYNGAWLNKESFRMEEIDAAPLYPASAWKSPGVCRVAVPLPMGEINSAFIPQNPLKAIPGLAQSTGYEAGFAHEALLTSEPGWLPARFDDHGLLNLNSIAGTVDHAAAFVSFNVYCPKPCRTHAALYGDNYTRLFVNGVLVESAQNFGAPGGFVYPPLKLNAGWNNVTSQLINNRGDWFLRLLVADPDGVLRFAAESD